MSEEFKQVMQKFSEFGFLKKEMQARIGLLLHTRNYEREKLEVMVEIAEINQHLENLHSRVKVEKTNSREEDRLFMLIREFEDRRFKLLNQLNGDDISEYNILPLHLSR